MHRRTSLLAGALAFLALSVGAPVLADTAAPAPVKAVPGGQGHLKVRRVVTGFDGGGKAVVSSDQVVEDSLRGPSGLKIAPLWAYDEKIGFAAPDAYTAHDPTQLKTNDLLMKWSSYELPPGGGMVPMHSTRTVDLLTMLEGELTMVLDSGAVVVLKAHDVLLQRGVVHAWENRSAQPARWTTVTLGRLKD